MPQFFICAGAICLQMASLFSDPGRLPGRGLDGVQKLGAEREELTQAPTGAPATGSLSCNLPVATNHSIVFLTVSLNGRGA
jgi:hypothetical protein